MKKLLTLAIVCAFALSGIACGSGESGVKGAKDDPAAVKKLRDKRYDKNDDAKPAAPSEGAVGK